MADALAKEAGWDIEAVTGGLESFEPLVLPETFLQSYMIKPVSRAEMVKTVRTVAAALRRNQKPLLEDSQRFALCASGD